MTIVWIVLTAFIVATLQVIVVNKTGLKKLTYERYFNTRAAHVGDNIKMVEIISNNKIIPVPWLKVEARMPEALLFKEQSDLKIKGKLYHCSVFLMGMFRKITRTHYVKCVKRGYYHLNTLSLTSGSLFGFSQKIKEITMDLQLSIYPRILAFDEIPNMSKQLLGDIIVKRWIAPDPFLVNGIRPYVQGDSLKDVHWGATAKSGDLKIKTKDYSSSPNLLVLLNVEITEFQWEVILHSEAVPIEYGITLASTIVIWAMKNGLKAGFGTNGYLQDDADKKTVFVHQDGGAGGIKNILEVMAQIVVARKLSFYSYLEELISNKVRDTDILILTTFMSDRIQDKINILKALGNTVNIQDIRYKGDSYE